MASCPDLTATNSIAVILNTFPKQDVGNIYPLTLLISEHLTPLTSQDELNEPNLIAPPGKSMSGSEN